MEKSKNSGSSPEDDYDFGINDREEDYNTEDNELNRKLQNNLAQNQIRK